MAPLNKKGHILELKKALKINFSVFSAAVRSLVAPTVDAGESEVQQTPLTASDP